MIWIATASVLGASVFYKLGAVTVWMTVQLWLIKALIALIAAAGIAYAVRELRHWRKSVAVPKLPYLT